MTNQELSINNQQSLSIVGQLTGYQRKPGQNAHWDWLNSPEAETLTV